MIYKLFSNKLFRTSLVLSILLSASLFFVYCSDSKVEDPYSSDLKSMRIMDISVGDSVDVYNVVFNDTTSTITFYLTLHAGFTSTNFHGKVAACSPQNLDTGWIAELYNSSMTDTLWTHEVKWDFNDTTWVGIKEITEGDELYSVFSESADCYIETYYQNDDTVILCYDTSLYTGMTGDKSGYSQAEIDIIDSINAEFTAFYDTTLAFNDNVYGEILVSLIDTEDFWTYLQDVIYDGHVPAETMTTDQDVMSTICSIAWKTLTIKCKWYGQYNPLCYAAGGTFIACAVKWLYDKLTNQSN